MSFDALIPLRGGSKGIKNKNIKLLKGKPLCNYVLEACIASKNINQIWVSTDSTEIIKVVKDLSKEINIIERPKELSTDTSTTESVLLHALDMLSATNIILLQATSPLTKPEQIDEAINLFKNEKFDSLLRVGKSEKFLWDKSHKPINYDFQNRKRRQDLDNYYVETGSFYISKKSFIKESKCRLSGNIGSYTLPAESIFEIDSIEDWCIIEKLLY